MVLHVVNLQFPHIRGNCTRRLKTVVKNDNRNLLLITSAYESLRISHAVNIWKTEGYCLCFLLYSNKLAVGVTQRRRNRIEISRLRFLLLSRVTFCALSQDS